MTPKALDKYPNVYQQIIRQAYHTGVNIPCPDILTAKTMRTNLYNYRTVLAEEALTNQDLKPLSNMAEQLTFTIERNKLLIIPKHKELSSESIQEINPWEK